VSDTLQNNYRARKQYVNVWLRMLATLDKNPWAIHAVIGIDGSLLVAAPMLPFSFFQPMYLRAGFRL
jgi:hypothetical protein